VTAPPTDRKPRSGRTRLRPERRTRGDVTVAVLLTALLVGGAVALWGMSPAARTISRPSPVPVPAPPPAAGTPAGFTEAWRATSTATSVPVVAGPAVVTADGTRVLGRDPVTGAERWSYERDRALCALASGFPGADHGQGRILALYAGTGDWCSELTALRPGTGERATANNPDLHVGTRLLAGGSSVVATGTDYLEVMRSDLVRTLEYGALPTPAQPGRQPRTGCTYGSVALTSDRLGVIERCPGEPTDRLTVLATDGDGDADEPQVQFSVAVPTKGAVLVAVTADRAAVALPGPPRLLVLDATGQQLDLVDLDVPAADLASDPPGGAAPVETDGESVYWWTGSRTVALDALDLVPRWVLPGTLGPAVAYGPTLLVPVPGAISEVDPTSGVARRTIPVDRGSDAPVRLAALGEVLLEQRGTELVALRPTG
jgi:hypothetical protein